MWRFSVRGFEDWNGSDAGAETHGELVFKKRIWVNGSVVETGKRDGRYAEVFNKGIWVNGSEVGSAGKLGRWFEVAITFKDFSRVDYLNQDVGLHILGVHERYEQCTHLTHNMRCLEGQSQPVTSNNVRNEKEHNLIKNNDRKSKKRVNHFVQKASSIIT